MGSGCGPIGRAVASNTRGPWFESAKFILNIVYCELYRKDENKEKEAGNGPFLKTLIKNQATREGEIKTEHWKNSIKFGARFLRKDFHANGLSTCFGLEPQVVLERVIS